MAVMYFNVKQGIQTGNVVIDAASGNISNIGNITLVGGTSANLGNLTISNYFRGNGSLLTSITGANVTGYVPNATAANAATTAGTVTTAAQPNITSLGTLSGVTLSSNGNIAMTGPASQISGGNLVNANYISGNGSLLTSITGSSVTGYVPNATDANTAGTVTTNAQPNITSLGTLTSVTLSSNGNISMNGVASQISGGNLVNANYISGNGSLLTSITGSSITGYVPNATDANTAGTVTTNAQPNITSLGSLTGLTSTGVINFLGTSNVSLGNVSNLHIDGGSAGYVLQTDGAGTLTFVSAGSTGIAGVNTEVQFNDGGSFGASNTFTFNKGTNTLSVTNYVGNGAGFTFITGSNVSGNVDSAIQSNYANTANSVAGANVSGQVGNALVAGTVYTAAQPNITSVGTLLGISVTGNLDITGNINATGNLNYSNVNDLVVGDPLIYLGANNTGNLYDLGFVASYNDGTYEHTGLARDATDGTWKLFDGVVAEPTTVIDFANGTYAPFKSGSFESTGNILALNANLGNLATASYFSGNGYYLTGIQSSGGSANTAGTVTTNAQPNITSVGTLSGVTLTTNGNISMNGPASQISGGNLVSANYVSGNGYYLTSVQAAGGNADTAGTVTTNAQPNITSTGTLTGVTIGSNGNISMNGVASQISGANLVSANYVSGTLTTAAQPNITSVGTLSGVTLTTNGNISMNGVASQISGGNLVSANYVSGTLTTASQPSITSVGTLSGVTIGSNGNISMNGVASQISGGNLVSANYVSGTLTTAAQPNITSVGNLSILNVTGNVSAGNIKSDNLLYANGSPYVFTTNAAGSNTQVQFNDNNAFAGSTAFTFDKASNTLTVGSIATTGAGTGNISGANYVIANYFSGNGSLLTSLTGANVTGYVPNATAANTAISATTAGTVTTNAQPNITSVGTLSNLSVTGTVTTGSVSLTNGLTSNRSNVSVTTSTVIDQFTPSTYRTAKYIVSASGDDGYQSIETLLVHDGSSAYITIYGSVCSNVSADIVELSSNVNGVSGNVTLYATSASPNAKVNVVVTYINT